MWTLSHDDGLRWGYMTTNIVESYNAVLKNARQLSVATLAKRIFYNCVAYWRDRRADAEAAISRHKFFTPWARSKINRWEKSASTHVVFLWEWTPDVIYEVQTSERQMSYGYKGGRRLQVNLTQEQCTCGKWKIWRIPCSHALAAMKHRGLNYEPFIPTYYDWNNQMMTYSKRFQPILWQPSLFTTMIPDSTRKRKAGRPRSSRIRNEMDFSASSSKGPTYKCSKCGGIGHNKRKCPSW